VVRRRGGAGARGGPLLGYGLHAARCHAAAYVDARLTTRVRPSSLQAA
jgi:hypothetical protein